MNASRAVQNDNASTPQQSQDRAQPQQSLLIDLSSDTIVYHILPHLFENHPIGVDALPSSFETPTHLLEKDLLQSLQVLSIGRGF